MSNILKKAYINRAAGTFPNMVRTNAIFYTFPLQKQHYVVLKTNTVHATSFLMQMKRRMSKTWFRPVFRPFLGLRTWLGPVLGTLLCLKTWLGPVLVSSYGPAALSWWSEMFTQSQMRAASYSPSHQKEMGHIVHFHYKPQGQ